MLANVAGIVQFGRIETVTEDEWDRVHAVDLKGPFMLIQAALPAHPRGQGQHHQRLVGGRQRRAALRHGVRRREGRADPAHQGARARAVAGGHPGQRDLPRHRRHPDRRQVFHKLTDDLDNRVADRLMMMLPGGAIQPSEIGETIVWLASPSARMITGAVIAHDGGMS